MAINRQPVLKKCRSLGVEPAFLGVVKKKSIKKPKVTNRKVSEYGLQLKEKQKAKFIYGVLEKQFKLYFLKANKMEGIAGENLLKLLELRLDNVVYRLGFGRTRKEARQIVSHNHILVNGNKVNIPSYQVKVGDTIEIRENAKTMERYKEVLNVTSGNVIVPWLNADKENLKGSIISIPSRDQIDTPVYETLIVELYSK